MVKIVNGELVVDKHARPSRSNSISTSSSSSSIHTLSSIFPPPSESSTAAPQDQEPLDHHTHQQRELELPNNKHVDYEEEDVDDDDDDDDDDDASSYSRSLSFTQSYLHSHNSYHNTHNINPYLAQSHHFNTHALTHDHEADNNNNNNNASSSSSSSSSSLASSTLTSSSSTSTSSAFYHEIFGIGYQLGPGGSSYLDVSSPLPPPPGSNSSHPSSATNNSDSTTTSSATTSTLEFPSHFAPPPSCAPSSASSGVSSAASSSHPSPLLTSAPRRRSRQFIPSPSIHPIDLASLSNTHVHHVVKPPPAVHPPTAATHKAHRTTSNRSQNLFNLPDIYVDRVVIKPHIYLLCGLFIYFIGPQAIIPIVAAFFFYRWHLKERERERRNINSKLHPLSFNKAPSSAQPHTNSGVGSAHPTHNNNTHPTPSQHRTQHPNIHSLFD